PVGFPPRSVSEETRQWAEWEYPILPNGEVSKKRERKVRREKTRLFPVHDFSYAFEMEGVETCMGFKVDLKFTVMVRGVNPEIALVRNDDWYFRMEAAVEAR